MKQVCEATALTKSTLYRLIDQGRFPKPIRYTDVPSRKAFDSRAVEAWIAAQVGD